MVVTLLRFLSGLAGIAGVVGLFSLDYILKVVGGTPPAGQSNLYLEWGTPSVLILVITSSLYVLGRAFLLRDRPLTILSTKVWIEIDATDPRKYTVMKHQIIRANNPTVNAVYGRAYPSPSAIITAPTATASSPSGITHSFYSDGSPTSGWESIHRFVPALPFPWYSSLLPDWLFNEDYKNLKPWLKACVVERHSLTAFDETSCKVKPYHGLLAERYVQKNLKVALRIPRPVSGTINPEKIQQRVSAWVLTRFAVTDCCPAPTPDGTGFKLEVFLKRLHTSEFRFQWEPNLFS